MTDEISENNGPEIVCSVTGKPAELLIRNSFGRLVPMVKSVYERLLKGRENLLPLLQKAGKEEIASWLDGSFDELSLDEHTDEYWAQIPNSKEDKRRKRIEIMKDFEMVIGLWTKKDLIPNEELAERLKKDDKNIDDYHISRLKDYPNDGIHTVIVANKALDDDSIKLIWDEQIKSGT